MSVYTASETNFGTSPNVPPADKAADKSLGELFADLSRESSQLVRQEIDLAKTELTQKAVRAGKGAGMVAGGGIVAATGLLVLTAFFVCLLMRFGLAAWAATLIVAAVYLIVGSLVAMQGVSALKHINPVPQATGDSIKEGAKWLKSEL